MVRVRGSYALELMFKDYPGEIWVARKDSPMIIGIADGETYVASDVPAILKYTRNVYYIGNLEFAKLVPGEAHFYDLNGDEIEKETTEIKWDACVIPNSQDWQGMLTLPRELELKDGKIWQTPVREIEK